MIDPNRQYRTRDGRAVRIYATDGGPHQVHGAVQDQPSWWSIAQWDDDGKHPLRPEKDLVEVTLADELRDQIPWAVLRPEIRWVAMDHFGDWNGGMEKPKIVCCKGRLGDMYDWQWPGRVYDCEAVFMPEVDSAFWRETLIERPEAT